MERKANRSAWLKVLTRKGWDGLLAELESATGYALELFSVSTDWAEDESYILKAKGVRGDLIVSWVK